ncbi:polyprenyl synthetase family protein [Microscilla marina]|uniref:Geranylgeranyl pyrophosphate synthetase (Ggpp synthetase) (Ggps) n=1 Tax=Microscilla marina ATCC 23134 TaxID=313606 RepID=A1ZEX4_MICM2|nr:polyprenyl synthetase family protein [Microscilla marina]EAY31076.1 geranylgeranyl pyrophosphate synthetase (ggpp synthetase) (ggps) [Microscilla marina ATCC 23134]
MDIKTLQTDIHTALAGLQYGEHPVELYEPIRYIMSLGGKRMRPLLVLLGYSLFDDNHQKAMNAALSVEVFHNFTLVHDDIMDEAPLRRGKPTIHQKWNTNTGILSGDVMLVQAYELLLDIDSAHLKRVIGKFNRCAAEVCEGQQLDMNFEHIDAVPEADYLNMIRLKTAVLLGYSLELGGIVANANKVAADLLNGFGVNIGVGFQLMDDLLDVYADAAKFGKQVGGDIIANKKTFLLINALKLAEGKTKQALERWLSLTEFDKAEKVQAVTEIYNHLGIKALTEAKMNEYFDMGLQQLDAIEANETAKAALRAFTVQLMNRDR